MLATVNSVHNVGSSREYGFALGPMNYGFVEDGVPYDGFLDGSYTDPQTPGEFRFSMELDVLGSITLRQRIGYSATLLGFLIVGYTTP